MKSKLLFIFLAVLIAPAVVVAESPIIGIVDDDHPRDRFIVVFDRQLVRGVSEVRFHANALAAAHGAEILSVYDTMLGGFAAEMPESVAEEMARSPLVEYVSHDVRIRRMQQVQTSPDWGLDRADQRTVNLDNQYIYDHDGTTVHIFVVDSGVFAGHADFGGRVRAGGNFVQDGNDELTGCGDGHGTHVAGIAAGETWGVGKSATIWSVRVLPCSVGGPGGSFQGVLDGLQATKERIISGAGMDGTPERSVVNLSFGASPPQILPALDTAIDELIDEANAVVVHAAGNSDIDACDTSPKHVRAISAGATNINDSRGLFPNGGRSNWGSCVDIFAPGIEIESAGVASVTDSTVKHGTSMSSPFVAGKVALFIQQNQGLANDPDAVKQRVTAYNATHNVLSAIPSGTPNKLMFSRDDLYRPDTFPSFMACLTTTIARYSVVTDGDYGVETEMYTREIDRGAVGSWDLIDSNSDTVTTVDVSSQSQFRVRGRYGISLGTSSNNTSGVITVPDCSHCHTPPCL